MATRENEQVPTVDELMSAVMDDVKVVAKRDRNVEQRFSFRGVDAVVNAVGPIVREHRLKVVPKLVSVEHQYLSMGEGKRAPDYVTVVVEYEWRGPSGDTVSTITPGAAMDWGDKAVAKAMSVAYRTMLIQALMLPTDEIDPDAETFDVDHGPQTSDKPEGKASGTTGGRNWLRELGEVETAEQAQALYADAEATGAHEQILARIKLRGEQYASEQA